MTDVNIAWETTGSIPADALLPARLQAHIAAHIVAGPAKILAKPEPDYGHVALTWKADAESGALTTQRLGGGFACALSISTMELSVVPSLGCNPFALNGSTRADAKAWISGQVTKSHGMKLEEPIPDPKEWPDHPVAQGAPFDCSKNNAFAELARHFNNAAVALQPLSQHESHATPVRTWPHHFDTATLVSLDPDLDPEIARSINIGFSLGDSQFSEPYWYVVPYPDPKSAEIPTLPDNGFWHLDGWTGAILNASTYGEIDSPQTQHERVTAFLDVAYTACRNILEETDSR